jgi:hypothetical protein
MGHGEKTGMMLLIKPGGNYKPEAISSRLRSEKALVL